MSINKRKNELENKVSEISKSIASNLDYDNLINSIVTLVYHNLNFSRVSIYIDQNEQNCLLKKVSISNSGIESTIEHYPEDNNNPITWSTTHRKPLIVNNTSQENRHSEPDYDIISKSEFVIPLQFGEMFIGVLDLCNEKDNYFSSDNTQILLTLSEYITLALRNAKLYRSELLKSEIFESLQKAIGKISAQISEKDICKKILDELVKLLPIDVCAIWLVDDVISEIGIDQFISALRFIAVYLNEEIGSTDDHFQNMNLAEINDKLISYDEPGVLFSEFPYTKIILESKDPIIINSEFITEPLSKILSYNGEFSILGIPLNTKFQNLGMIIAVNHLPDKYDDESVFIASTFAQYVPVAIENTRLFSVTHEQVWMNTILQQVIEAIRSITSIGELVEMLTSMLVDLVGVSGCTLYMIDKNEYAFFPYGSYGFNEEQQARLNSFNILPGTVNAFEIVIQKMDIVILNSDTISDDIASLIFPSYDLKSDLMILFPMINQNDLIGAILIDFTDSELLKKSSQKHWDDLFSLIKGILNHAAASIVILQTIKSREEEAYISIALSQVAQAIVSLNQLDEILGSVVRITPLLVGVKKCIIYLWDDSEKVFIQVQKYGFSKNEFPDEKEKFLPGDFPIINKVFENNKIAYHQLDQSLPLSQWKEIKTEAIHVIEGVVKGIDEEYMINIESEVLQARSQLLIGFPLSVKGEVLGVMIIEEDDPIKNRQSYHIREKRIEIVTGITQQAALAIKNEYLQREVVKSIRMEQELLLARDIQKTFLPDHVPVIPGWEIDIRWQPARQVAGDFYDFFYVEENKLGFVIADVADKGMPAALFMTLIRTLIRAAAKDQPSPAAVFKQVNELLFPDAKNGMFVTVFYAVINLESGLITYANAGHNPPVFYSFESNNMNELTRTSVALGIFNDIDVQEASISLKSGDWIFFYTDGITEAFSSNEEMYGVKRLHDLLKGTYHSSSKAILDNVEKSVHEFIKGADLSDDITLAAIYNKLGSIY
jgi:serine phosphatase RsbU (regulator of sigma subunit)